MTVLPPIQLLINYMRVVAVTLHVSLLVLIVAVVSDAKCGPMTEIVPATCTDGRFFPPTCFEIIRLTDFCPTAAIIAFSLLDILSILCEYVSQDTPLAEMAVRLGMYSVSASLLKLLIDYSMGETSIIVALMSSFALATTMLCGYIFFYRFYVKFVVDYSMYGIGCLACMISFVPTFARICIAWNQIPSEVIPAVFAMLLFFALFGLALPLAFYLHRAYPSYGTVVQWTFLLFTVLSPVSKFLPASILLASTMFRS